MTDTAETVSDGYLALLAARGVDYFFANAGTDFPPIIEAFAKAQTTGAKLPTPVIVPHENLALAMAHGYYQITGRAQVVMVHVHVGTANGICGLINAIDQKVPVLFTAGRTPIHETGMHGGRNRVIHWAQEMFDQGGMVREHVKWDYELRSAQQLQTVVDRALQVAMSEPRGPVYLTLPREVIGAPLAAAIETSPSRLLPAPAALPNPRELERAAALLAKAEKPLIITADVGRHAASVKALEAFAERFAIPVIQHHPRFINIAHDHPMNLGLVTGELLKEADLVIAAECDVPWIPSLETPAPGYKVIQLGLDPIFPREPIRGFAGDAVLTGIAEDVLPMLTKALDEEPALRPERLAGRCKALAARRAAMLDAAEARAAAGRQKRPIDPAYANRCIAEACGTDAIYVNEYPFQLDQLRLNTPGTFFGSTPAGGLGWGFGAALGTKLAARDKLVVLGLGDGAYIFNNPVAGHYVAQAEDLPLLTVVFNNGGWEAVRRSNRMMYPGGHAMRSNRMPLSDFSGETAFEQVVRASGGFGERVDDPAALPKALDAALRAVTVEKRQALLNIRTAA
jgi:acetolactate synthase I/II/III large subunit